MGSGEFGVPTASPSLTVLSAFYPESLLVAWHHSSVSLVFLTLGPIGMMSVSR